MAYHNSTMKKCTRTDNKLTFEMDNTNKAPAIIELEQTLRSKCKMTHRLRKFMVLLYDET